MFQDKKLVIVLIVDLVLTLGVPFIVLALTKLSGNDSFAYALLFAIFGVINGIIALVQDYSIQFLLTEGGPGYDTMVPGYYMYQAAFQSGRMGFACAIGTFLFLIILGLTLLSFRLSRGKEKR